MTKKPTTPDIPSFTFGDIVRKKVNKEEAGMVVGLLYRPNGSTEFMVNWASSTCEERHYDIELVLSEDVVEKPN